MKTSRIVTKLLFVIGALACLAGLWISCPLLSGKGYFLDVLMMTIPGNYVYLHVEKPEQLDDFLVHVCRLVALIIIGLLLIGVLNASISAYEVTTYPVASFVCLLGQTRSFRSA